MEIKTILKILEKKLDINQFTILSLLRDGEDISPIIENSRMLGVYNLLVRKKYISEKGEIFSETLKLIEDVGNVGEVGAAVETKKDATLTPFDQWTEEFLIKMKGELFKHIAKKQIMGFGKVYFIPTTLELRTHLLRFSKENNISLSTEQNKIEEVILRHIRKCAKTKSFSPAVKYFITKDKSSALAAALEDYEDTKIEDNESTEYKPKEIRNVNDLFG